MRVPQEAKFDNLVASLFGSIGEERDFFVDYYRMFFLLPPPPPLPPPLLPLIRGIVLEGLRLAT